MECSFPLPGKQKQDIAFLVLDAGLFKIYRKHTRVFSCLSARNKHPRVKRVVFHMRAKPFVLRGRVKRVIRPANCVRLLLAARKRANFTYCYLFTELILL
jgi:hypothetical protein